MSALVSASSSEVHLPLRSVTRGFCGLVSGVALVWSKYWIPVVSEFPPDLVCWPLLLLMCVLLPLLMLGLVPAVV